MVFTLDGFLVEITTPNEKNEAKYCFASPSASPSNCHGRLNKRFGRRTNTSEQKRARAKLLSFIFSDTKLVPKELQLQVRSLKKLKETPQQVGWLVGCVDITTGQKCGALKAKLASTSNFFSPALSKIPMACL